MGKRQSHLITSFSVPDTKENREMLTALEQLAAKDGWSLSELIRNALTEYAQRHFPGNPQLALAHWTIAQPLPITIQESKRVKLEDIKSEKQKASDERWAKLNSLSDEELKRRYDKINQLPSAGPESMEIMIILKSREKK